MIEKNPFRYLIVLSLLAILGLTGCAGVEVSAQAQPGPFQNRLEQSVRTAPLGVEGVWIGYGLHLPLEPTTLLIQGIPMSWQGGSLEFQGTFLDELITPGSSVPDQLAISPGEWEGEKVLRRVAVLFGYSRDRELERVLLINRELPLDLSDREFVWLGEVDRTESLRTIERLFSTNSEPETRQRLVSTVGWHQSNDAVRFLQQAVEEAELEVRVEAIRGFRHFPNLASVNLMTRLARSQEELKIRTEAVSILGRMENPSAGQALIGLLDPTDDLKLQSRIVQVLSRLDSVEARSAVLALIDSDAPERLRQEAVSRIARHQDPEFIRPRLDAWALSSSSSAVRRAAVEQLSRIFLPAALETLQRVIRSDEDSKVISQAISGLRRLPDAEAATVLGRLAEKASSAHVRLEAVRGLAKLQAEDQVARLERIARSDPEIKIEKTAVEALRRVSGNAAIDSLIKLSEDHPNPEIRRSAVREMAHLASEKVSRQIEATARRDPDRKVQAEAVTVLRKLSTPETIRALVAIAKDHPVYEIRRHAIRELGRSESPDAKNALLEMAREN